MGTVGTLFAQLWNTVSHLPAFAAIGAISLLVFRPLIERWLRGRTSWQAIEQEVIDISRHFDRNTGRLREMQSLMSSQNMLPVRIHIQKLAISDKSMLFSDKVLEDLHYKRIAIIHRARVRLRKYNIDVMESLRTLDDDQWDRFSNMLAYLSKTNARLSDWSANMLSSTDVSGEPLPILGRPNPSPVSGS